METGDMSHTLEVSPEKFMAMQEAAQRAELDGLDGGLAAWREAKPFDKKGLPVDAPLFQEVQVIVRYGIGEGFALFSPAS